MESNVVVDAIKERIPSLKTQAQMDALMAAVDALMLHAESIFGGRSEDEQAITLSALVDAFSLARRATAIARKIADVPDVPVSPIFTEPPKEYGEADLAGALMDELAAIDDPTRLDGWYKGSKSRFDQIVSQGLRNDLFDAVRTKKLALTKLERDGWVLARWSPESHEWDFASRRVAAPMTDVLIDAETWTSREAALAAHGANNPHLTEKGEWFVLTVKDASSILRRHGGPGEPLAALDQFRIQRENT